MVVLHRFYCTLCSLLGNPKVLTSCLFYLAENRPVEFLAEDNLLCCLEACIVLIIEWIDNGVCPNYFILDENMFRIKTDQQLLKDNLSSILTLKAPIPTKVVCFSSLLKCLRSLYDKQCGPRSNCSYRSSLI